MEGSLLVLPAMARRGKSRQLMKQLFESWRRFIVEGERNKLNSSFKEWHQEVIESLKEDGYDPQNTQKDAEGAFNDGYTPADFEEEWLVRMGLLQEGGNVFAGKTADIPKEYIQPTLERYYQELGRLFPKHKDVFPKFEPVGSVGKKPTSGDIDLALDLKDMFGDGEINTDELSSWNVDTESWKKTFLRYKKRARTATDAQVGWRAFLTEIANYINANSSLIIADLKKVRPGNLFTMFPQFTPEGEQQDIGVQIDWMVGNFEWLTFSYFSDVVPEEESYMKGLHRTQLILSLFLVKDHTFSHTAGVINKDTGQVVAQSPTEAFKLIGSLYGTKITKKDTKNFSKLYSWMQENLQQTEINRTIDAYLKILDRTKSTKVKDETSGEVQDCGYIPQALQDYWLENRERLGLTGKYICRQTNPKLADSMMVSEEIRKVDSKWCLYSKKKGKDGKRKNLGCYSSKKGAQDREKQVQYFKHAK
jgi:hypothetical protein